MKAIGNGLAPWRAIVKLERVSISLRGSPQQQHQRYGRCGERAGIRRVGVIQQTGARLAALKYQIRK